jgi:hypothetical protein
MLSFLFFLFQFMKFGQPFLHLVIQLLYDVSFMYAQHQFPRVVQLNVP